jgi:hypothetical protein
MQRQDHFPHHHGAKTFRRGRAIAFLERMKLKRDTLKKQLETPELQSIHPILVGELKAIDMVIDEFVQLFEIHECELRDSANQNHHEQESGS